MKKASGMRPGRPPTVPKAIVRRIQRQRARSDTLRAIADSLNRDRVPTAQGGAQWHAATVRGVWRGHRECRFESSSRSEQQWGSGHGRRAVGH
jgi:hypothetical protein